NYEPTKLAYVSLCVVRVRDRAMPAAAGGAMEAEMSEPTSLNHGKEIKIMAQRLRKSRRMRKRANPLWLKSRKFPQMLSKLSIGMRLLARPGHSFRSRWTARSSRWV